MPPKRALQVRLDQGPVVLACIEHDSTLVFIGHQPIGDTCTDCLGPAVYDGMTGPFSTGPTATFRLCNSHGQALIRYVHESHRHCPLLVRTFQSLDAVKQAFDGGHTIAMLRLPENAELFEVQARG